MGNYLIVALVAAIRDSRRALRVTTIVLFAPLLLGASGSHRKIRGGSAMMVEKRALLAAGLVLWAVASTAQIASPPAQSNPLAPSPRGPENTVRTDTGNGVILRWRQQEISPTNTNAPARYFLLCVYVPATSDCTSTSLRWMESATRIQRVPVTHTSTSGPPFVLAYDYTFSFDLEPSMFDRQVEWRVGACGSELASSCTFVTTPVWFSTHNLVAENISDGPSTSQLLWLTGEVRNLGVRNSGPFETRLFVYEALADQYGRCITDVNAEGVDTELGDALTDKGRIIRLSELPRDANGRLDARRHTIVAILTADVGSASMGHGGLTPDTSATVVEFTADLSSYRLPATFATRLYADTDNVLIEYYESDNVKGECHTIYGK